MSSLLNTVHFSVVLLRHWNYCGPSNVRPLLFVAKAAVKGQERKGTGSANKFVIRFRKAVERMWMVSCVPNRPVPSAPGPRFSNSLGISLLTAEVYTKH